jgi:hypothetical protein
MVMSPNRVSPSFLIVVGNSKRIVNTCRGIDDPSEDCENFVGPDCLYWMGLASRKWVRCGGCQY